MAPLTTVTICVSETELAAGLEAGTCSAERSVVIHNAVDVASAPRSRHDRATPRLIAVGRLKAPKDFLTLIRALAALADQEYEALIVGDGPDRSEVEAEIQRLGLEDRVQLAGERSDVPELLAESDVFVLSSRSEGLPVSVLEAMAAELPVVASRRRRACGARRRRRDGHPRSARRRGGARTRRSVGSSKTASCGGGSALRAAPAPSPRSTCLRSGVPISSSTTGSSA